MSITLAKSVQFGGGNTGLGTVGYSLLNPDGSGHGGRVTAGIHELAAGSGWYGASVVFPDGFTGFLAWDTGGDAPYSAGEDINLAGADVIVGGYAAGQDPATLLTSSFTTAVGSILAKLGAIQIIMTAPVTLTGELAIIQGEDYFAADGRAVVWTNAGGSDWPSLLGGSVAWEFRKYNSREIAVSFDATVINATTVQLELSAADTATVPYSRSEIRDTYELWATLANGHRVRLASGSVYVG